MVTFVIWGASLIALMFNLFQPWPDAMRGTDFVSYWTAARMLVEGLGGQLFDLEMQCSSQAEYQLSFILDTQVRSEITCNPYPNMPPLALLYVPFTFLSLPLAYLLWWPVNLASLLVALRLALGRHESAWNLTAVGLAYGGVAVNLMEGQPYGFFLLALVCGVMAMRRNHPLLGGFLLGLLWLKPQYALLFGLLFLAKRRWSELVGMAGAGILVVALSLVLVGTDGMSGYLNVITEIGGLRAPSVSPQGMVNWRAVILALWPAIPDVQGYLAMLLLGGVTMAAGVVAWRGPWEPTSTRFPLQILVVVLASIIVSPHSHMAGAVLALGPVCLALGCQRLDRESSPLLRPTLILGLMLSLFVWPIFQFGTLRWLTAIYGAVLLVVAVRYCRVETALPPARLAVGD